MAGGTAQNKTSLLSNPQNKVVLIIIFVLGVLVILTAGGFLVQNKSTETTQKSKESMTNGQNGSKTTFKTQEGKITISENKVPKSFPPDVTIYKNSKVQSSTEAEDGISVTSTTADSISTVTNFYQEDLAKNGWTVERKDILKDNSLITAKKDKRQFILTTKVGHDKSTEIIIVVGTP